MNRYLVERRLVIKTFFVTEAACPSDVWENSIRHVLMEAEPSIEKNEVLRVLELESLNNGQKTH